MGRRCPSGSGKKLWGTAAPEQTLQYTHTPSEQAREILEALAAKLVKAAHLDAPKRAKIVRMKKASGQ